MSRNTTKRPEFVSGWIDTSIHEFLVEIESPPASMSYALITCLDSSFDVAKALHENKALRRMTESGRKVGRGMLVRTRDLLDADRLESLFFGFDEIWFFGHPDVKAKPKSLVIVGPDRISADMRRPLDAWMRSEGCALGLGDGVGMNFCAKLSGLARFLVEAFAETVPSNRDEAVV